MILLMLHLNLTWSEKCIIVAGNCVPVVTLSAQDNERKLENYCSKLKTGFKKTIYWNRYQSEPTLQT